LHNEELHNLYSAPNIIRMMKSRWVRWTGYVARMGEKNNACRILVGKLERQRPLGRPRRKWVDSVKIYLRKILRRDMDWIYLTRDSNQWRALVYPLLLPILSQIDPVHTTPPYLSEIHFNIIHQFSS
jgi:hypothetical protein